MWIDVVLGIIVIAYGIMGLFQGVIVQLFRLGGLVLIIFYARLVAEPIGQWLALHLRLNPLAAYYVSFIGGALIVYAVCALIGRGVHKLVVAQGERPQKANRLLGGVLGLAKGAIIAFVLAAIVDMIPPEKMGGLPWVGTQAKKSRLLARVHEVNPLPQARFLADIDDYKKVLEDPEAQRILQRQPAFVKLQDHPKFRVAVNDQELRKLVAEKHWPEVLVHEKVLALVFDREIRQLLNQMDPKTALEEAEKMRTEE